MVEPRVEGRAQHGGTEVWGGKSTVLFQPSELKTETWVETWRREVDVESGEAPLECTKGNWYYPERTRDRGPPVQGPGQPVLWRESIREAEEWPQQWKQVQRKDAPKASNGSDVLLEGGSGRLSNQPWGVKEEVAAPSPPMPTDLISLKCWLTGNTFKKGGPLTQGINLNHFKPIVVISFPFGRFRDWCKEK